MKTFVTQYSFVALVGIAMLMTNSATGQEVAEDRTLNPALRYEDLSRKKQAQALVAKDVEDKISVLEKKGNLTEEEKTELGALKTRRESVGRGLRETSSAMSSASKERESYAQMVRGGYAPGSKEALALGNAMVDNKRLKELESKRTNDNTMIVGLSNKEKTELNSLNEGKKNGSLTEEQSARLKELEGKDRGGLSEKEYEEYKKVSVTGNENALKAAKNNANVAADKIYKKKEEIEGVDFEYGKSGGWKGHKIYLNKPEDPKEAAEKKLRKELKDKGVSEDAIEAKIAANNIVLQEREDYANLVRGGKASEHKESLALANAMADNKRRKELEGKGRNSLSEEEYQEYKRVSVTGSENALKAAQKRANAAANKIFNTEGEKEGVDFRFVIKNGKKVRVEIVKTKDPKVEAAIKLRSDLKRQGMSDDDIDAAMANGGTPVPAAPDKPATSAQEKSGTAPEERGTQNGSTVGAPGPFVNATDSPSNISQNFPAEKNPPQEIDKRNVAENVMNKQPPIVNTKEKSGTTLK